MPQFLEVMWQRISGVADNVLYFCSKFNRLLRSDRIWKSVKIWQNYCHPRVAQLSTLNFDPRLCSYITCQKPAVTQTLSLPQLVTAWHEW